MNCSYKEKKGKQVIGLKKSQADKFEIQKVYVEDFISKLSF